MNYIPLIVMVLGLAAMAAVLIFKKKAGNSARENYFKQLGWEYQKGSSAHVIGDEIEKSSLNFTLKGKEDGISWTIASYLYMEIDNKSNKPFSIFNCVLPDIKKGTCILIPAFKNQAGNNKNIELLSYFSQISNSDILKKFGFNTDFISSLAPFEASSQVVNNSYNILATDNNICKKVLGQENEKNLAAYIQNIKILTNMPLISLDCGKLEIKLPFTLQKPEETRKLADFGIDFTRNILKT